MGTSHFLKSPDTTQFRKIVHVEEVTCYLIHVGIFHSLVQVNEWITFSCQFAHSAVQEEWESGGGPVGSDLFRELYLQINEEGEQENITFGNVATCGSVGIKTAAKSTYLSDDIQYHFTTKLFTF